MELLSNMQHNTTSAENFAAPSNASDALTTPDLHPTPAVEAFERLYGLAKFAIN